MSVAVAVAVAAAVVAAAAAAFALATVARARARTRSLEEEIERGKATFDEVVTREAIARAEELEQTLALARAEALSALAGDERRIAEERRRDVAERERDATTKLTGALAQAQRSVEQRFADWNTDLTALQQNLAAELERIGERQQQLIADVEAKIVAEADRLQATLDEHRRLIAKARGDLDQAARELAEAAGADLEAHAAERRRALHEVAERLRRRERELQELIEREQTEIAQRVASQLQEIERRQLEQVRRVVSREAQQGTEAATQQFDAAIRSAREEAARRLGRELDLAVERFAREAEGVLADRLESELRTVEARLQDLTRRVDALTTRA